MKRLYSIFIIIIIGIGLIYWKHQNIFDRYQRTFPHISAITNPIDSIIEQTGTNITQTGTSIHQTSAPIYQEQVARELPKLTKQTRSLLDHYQQEKDTEDLFKLVQSLTQDGAYYTAIQLYQILLQEFPDKATYPYYLKLLLNRGEYTQQFLTEYQQSIDTFYASGLMSQQDTIFFTSFRSLISGDVDTFYQTVNQLTGEYASIAKDLLTNFTTYSQYKQAPQQYLWGLFASTLLRHGYYSPAIHIAKMSLAYNPTYILGLQIMAYGNLMTHDRASAKIYLTKLMELDPSYLLTYQRLFGIASYWQGDYTDAVRYLTQIQNKIPSIEISRYIGLSYRSLYDYLHVAKTYRSMLTMDKLETVDFFEFFDTYRRAVGYDKGMNIAYILNPIDQYDETLLDDYIKKCASQLTTDDNYICQYGQALQLLFTAQIDSAIAIMETIARTYAYDFVYGTIGDMYIIKNDGTTAQIYYEKAIKSSYNGGYQTYLANKITQLSLDESSSN